MKYVLRMVLTTWSLNLSSAFSGFHLFYIAAKLMELAYKIAPEKIRQSSEMRQLKAMADLYLNHF